jgi:hypothetical protein
MLFSINENSLVRAPKFTKPIPKNSNTNPLSPWKRNLKVKTIKHPTKGTENITRTYQRKGLKRHNSWELNQVKSHIQTTFQEESIKQKWEPSKYSIKPKK